jgi:hypothetical protein
MLFPLFYIFSFGQTPVFIASLIFVICTSFFLTPHKEGNTDLIGSTVSVDDS